MKDTTVKIDSELLKKVEEIIKRKENKLKYLNKKHFIDIAVFEKIQKEEKTNEK